MAFTKGQIIWVEFKNRHPSRLKHPAVVWKDTDCENDFYGVMLTHSVPSNRFDNILMIADHFESGHEVSYSNTHFVNQVFIKFQDWGPFYQVGKLTKEGIQFIEDELTQTKPISFEEYIKSC